MACWITSLKSCTDLPDSKWLTLYFYAKIIGYMQIIRNQPIIVIGKYSSKRRNFASKARMILPFPKRKFSKQDYTLFFILKSELSGTIRQTMVERNHSCDSGIPIISETGDKFFRGDRILFGKDRFRATFCPTRSSQIIHFFDRIHKTKLATPFE